MGHAGMKYSLACREIIADSVETMVRAHCFDGMICIPNCDKIVPGMLMAAVRLNIPTIFVCGGPMEAGKTADGKAVDLISVFEGVGPVQDGQDRRGRAQRARMYAAAPRCGSCSGMFTANCMNCLCEALGMALPGNGTILAVDPKRQDSVQGGRPADRRAGREGPQAAATSSRLKSIDNAMILDMAMGGSTNTVLHTLAIASEAGIEYDLERINAISAAVPQHLQGLAVEQQVHVEDVDAAGGISAILKEISKVPGLLNLDCPTVTGKTLGENIANARDQES